MPETLEDAIADHMKLIDLELQAEELPLHQRPLRAAIWFVTKCIIEISGDTKEDFANKPWFAIIYHHIREWYLEHYGPALEERDGGATCSGVVLVRQVPVELRVPLTRVLPGEPGETIWLEFPVSVAIEENPGDWLVRPPNLDKLDRTAKRKVDKRIRDVATLLRRIRMHTQGVKATDPEIRGLIDGVMEDLDRAAKGLVTGDDTGRGGALWSLQMAIERTLKAFILQKTGQKYRATHDLFYLFDDAASHCAGINRNLLKKLPNSREMVDGRYGLGNRWTIFFATEAYFAGLKLVAEFSQRLERTISMGGGRIKLKRPPWLFLPEPSLPPEQN